MKHKALWFIMAGAAIVSLLLVIWRGLYYPDKKITPDTLPEYALVKTAMPVRHDFTEDIRWFGKVKSRDKVTITAMTSGRIISVSAPDETPVSAGSPLFRLGGVSLKSRLADLDNRVRHLKYRIKGAKRTVAIKKKAFSERLARYEELSSAEDMLARLYSEMESAVQEARRLRSAANLLAPVGGIFTGRMVSVGQMVQKGAALAEIVPTEHLYVYATLFPKDSSILVGKDAIIEPYGRGEIRTTVTAVLPKKTDEGGSEVLIEVPGSPHPLEPGERLSGTIILALHKDALAVPRDAIVRDAGNEAYLFIRDKDSPGYRRKHVITGIASGGLVEVVSGLEQEDSVVVQGAYELLYRDFKKRYKVAD